MSREDLSSARLAAPRRPPLPAGFLHRPTLSTIGQRVAERTAGSALTGWSWGDGVALFGLCRFGAAVREPFPPVVLAYLDRHIAAGVEVEHVNDLAPAIACVLAAEVTGERRYLDFALGLADWVRRSPLATRAANGALEHWPGSVWIDTAFMAGATLAHIGAAAGRLDLLEESGRQLVAHAELLQDPASGLFGHGTNCGRTLWSFWGRGNAWWALAAIEFLRRCAGMEVSHELMDEVRERLSRQLEALARAQPPDGVWDVLVDGQPETAGIIDTSAAAGIGAAMLSARRIIPTLGSDIAESGWRAIRGALAYVDESGALTRVSAGTVLQLVPFGYSVIRDDLMQPWGQGLALLAIAAAVVELGQEDDTA